MSVNKMLELMNDAPYGVYAVDMEQKIVFWNRSAERILGYKSQDVIGRHCYDVCASVSEDGLDLICVEGCPSIRMAREGITPPVMHVRMLDSSGVRVPVTITPLIVSREDEEEQSLLVHLFHEEATGSRRRTVGGRGRGRPVQETEKDDDDKDPSEISRDDYKPLSHRELQVLRLLAMALEAQEIAERLELSSHTILNHIRNARVKLKAKNRLEAVIAAQRLGLL